jgi:gentisate 1,2-dioxygenase
VDDAMKVTSPAAVERRVLTLTDPDAVGGAGSTTTNLTTGLQILLPGEKARPHRHTMSALRFVIEGKGASTVVDGKDCPMEEGDLITTPGWTWHEHVHRGDAPIVWLDALDAPLHRYLGTDVFEPGPAHDLPKITDDAAFAFPNIVPEISEPPAFSPVFRYPWAAAVAAVRAAPTWKDGTRRVRYVNPINGGPIMPTKAPRRCASAPPPTQSASCAKAAAPPRSVKTRWRGKSATCSVCRTATGSPTRRTRRLRCSSLPTATH